MSHSGLSASALWLPLFATCSPHLCSQTIRDEPPSPLFQLSVCFKHQIKVLEVKTHFLEQIFVQAMLIHAISLQTKEHFLSFLSYFFIFLYRSIFLPQWQWEESWKAGLRFHVCTLVFMQGCQHTARACLCPWDWRNGVAAPAFGTTLSFLWEGCFFKQTYDMNFNQSGWRQNWTIWLNLIKVEQWVMSISCMSFWGNFFNKFLRQPLYRCIFRHSCFTPGLSASALWLLPFVCCN